jgi:hypothetical protein
MYVMRLAHNHRPESLSDAPDVSDSTMKKAIYWIIVFLALISVVCLGIIIIHWSINTTLF